MSLLRNSKPSSAHRVLNFERIFDQPPDREPTHSYDYSEGRAGGQADPWAQCVKMLGEYDDKGMVAVWNAEIDTLLVFAALFSAIVTAFTIQSYPLLQADSTPSSLSITSQNFTSSSPVLSTQINPPSYAVQINVFWFLSLVFSLMTALTGIIIKQWLREYTATVLSTGSPRARLRVRQFRHDNMMRWFVPQIIAALPVVLQISLILFFVGLLRLLVFLHPAVAGIVTGAVGVSMILILLTIVLPSFSVHCPYQSPQSWIFFVIVRPLRIFFSQTSLRLPLKNSPKTTASTPLTGSPPLKNWRERDLAIAERFGDDLDVQILEIADQHFMNEDFLGNVVRPCIARMKRPFAVRCFYSIMAYRACCSVETIESAERIPLTENTTITLLEIALDIYKTIPLRTKPHGDKKHYHQRLSHIISELYAVVSNADPHLPMDEVRFDTKVRPFIEVMETESAIKCLYNVICRSTNCSMKRIKQQMPMFTARKLNTRIIRVAEDLLKQIPRGIDRDNIYPQRSELINIISSLSLSPDTPVERKEYYLNQVIRPALNAMTPKVAAEVLFKIISCRLKCPLIVIYLCGRIGCTKDMTITLLDMAAVLLRRAREWGAQENHLLDYQHQALVNVISKLQFLVVREVAQERYFGQYGQITDTPTLISFMEPQAAAQCLYGIVAGRADCTLTEVEDFGVIPPIRDVADVLVGIAKRILQKMSDGDDPVALHRSRLVYILSEVCGPVSSDHLRDTHMQDVIFPILQAMEPVAAATCFHHIVARRTRWPVHAVHEWEEISWNENATMTILNISADILRRMPDAGDSTAAHRSRLVNVVSSLFLLVSRDGHDVDGTHLQDVTRPLINFMHPEAAARCLFTLVSLRSGCSMKEIEDCDVIDYFDIQGHQELLTIASDVLRMFGVCEDQHAPSRSRILNVLSELVEPERIQSVLEESIRPCLESIAPGTAALCLYRVIARQAGCPRETIMSRDIIPCTGDATDALLGMAMDLFKKVHSDEDNQASHQTRLVNIVAELSVSVDASSRSVKDARLRDVVRPLIATLEPEVAVLCVYDIVAHRVGCSKQDIESFCPIPSIGKVTDVLLDITKDVASRTRAEDDSTAWHLLRLGHITCQLSGFDDPTEGATKEGRLRDVIFPLKDMEPESAAICLYDIVAHEAGCLREAILACEAFPSTGDATDLLLNITEQILRRMEGYSDGQMTHQMRLVNILSELSVSEDARSILAKETRLRDVLLPMLFTLEAKTAAECLYNIIARLVNCSSQDIKNCAAIPPTGMMTESLMDVAHDAFKRIRPDNDREALHRIRLINIMAELSASDDAHSQSVKKRRLQDVVCPLLKSMDPEPAATCLYNLVAGQAGCSRENILACGVIPPTGDMTNVLLDTTADILHGIHSYSDCQAFHQKCLINILFELSVSDDASSVFAKEIRLRQVLPPLLPTLGPKTAAECLYHIVAHCANCSPQSIKNCGAIPPTGVVTDVLMDMTKDIFNRICLEDDPHASHRSRLINILSELSVSADVHSRSVNCKESRLQNVIRPLLEDMDPIPAAICLSSIIEHRSDIPGNHFFDDDISGAESTAQSLLDISLGILQRLPHLDAMDPYHSRLNVMSRLYVLVIQTSKITDETYLQTVTRSFFRVMEPTAVAECIRTLSRLRGKDSAITLLLFALENERRCDDESGLLQDLTAVYHDSIVQYGILSDETRLEEVIRPLINRMPLELAAECLCRIVADCAQCSVEVLLGRNRIPAEFQPNDQLLNIALDILVKFRHRLSDTQLRHRLCLVNLICQLYPRLVVPSHSLIQNMWASFMICSGQEGIKQGLNFLFTIQLTAGTSLAAIQYVIAFANHTMHKSPTIFMKSFTIACNMACLIGKNGTNSDRQAYYQRYRLPLQTVLFQFVEDISYRPGLSFGVKHARTLKRFCDGIRGLGAMDSDMITGAVVENVVACIRSEQKVNYQVNRRLCLLQETFGL